MRLIVFLVFLLLVLMGGLLMIARVFVSADEPMLGAVRGGIAVVFVVIAGLTAAFLVAGCSQNSPEQTAAPESAGVAAETGPSDGAGNGSSANLFSVEGREHFQSEVLQSEKPVLVDFYADWCPPCKMLAPVIKDIAHEKADTIQVAKVNVDNHPRLASDYGVKGIPRLILVKNGEVVASRTGYAEKSVISSWIQENTQ